MRPLAAALALAGLAACAHRPAAGGEPVALEVEADGARFVVVHAPGDAAAARQVARALAGAAPRAQRFGRLVAPVTITVHPDHAALERAVDRRGYRWLRAWARHRTIDLKSPRRWGWLGAGDAEVEELLAHELAHCAMYQRAGTERTWMFRAIPRWFAEGLASVTAGEGRRRASVGELRRYYAEAAPARAGEGLPGAGGGGDEAGLPDPLVDPDPLYRDRARIVYGAGHHAVLLLVARHGEGAVAAILDRMGDGLRFPEAFREETGVAPEAFAAEFRAWVESGR